MTQVLASCNMTSWSNDGCETGVEPEGLMLLDHAWSFATLAGE